MKKKETWENKTSHELVKIVEVATILDVIWFKNIEKDENVGDKLFMLKTKSFLKYYKRKF